MSKQIIDLDLLAFTGKCCWEWEEIKEDFFLFFSKLSRLSFLYLCVSRRFRGLVVGLFVGGLAVQFH